jgi:hypothetical protein
MAESDGLPGWVEAWVGKVVQVHVHGDPDPLFGVLEDWDQRGVVLRHTEDIAAGGSQPPHQPLEHERLLSLLDWSSRSCVLVRLLPPRGRIGAQP